MNCIGVCSQMTSAIHANKETFYYLTHKWHDSPLIAKNTLHIFGMKFTFIRFKIASNNSSFYYNSFIQKKSHFFLLFCIFKWEHLHGKYVCHHIYARNAIENVVRLDCRACGNIPLEKKLLGVQKVVKLGSILFKISSWNPDSEVSTPKSWPANSVSGYDVGALVWT